MKLAISTSCRICDVITSGPAKCWLRKPQPPFSSFQLPIQKRRFRNLEAAIEKTKCDVYDSIMPFYGSRQHATTHAVLLEHVQLRVDGDALQVHGDGPEQVAVGVGAVWTDDEGEDHRGNDEEESGVLLGEEVALAEGVVVRVVRVLQGEHDQVDVEQHHHEGKSLNGLVEPVAASIANAQIHTQTCRKASSSCCCRQRWCGTGRRPRSTPAT